jgi:hypothetical protein
MKTTTSLMLAAVLCLYAGVVQATLIADYMEYGDTSASLQTLTTADTAGWDANGWSASSSSVRYNISITNIAGVVLSTNIVFSISGYTNNIDGGTVVGLASSGPAVTRGLSTSSSDALWVCIAADFTFYTAVSLQQRVQIGVNGTVDDSFGMASGQPGAPNATFRPLVLTNGVVATADTAGLPYPESLWLIMARLQTDASNANDKLDLWLFRDTADLSAQTYSSVVNQAYASFSVAGDDYWGSSITSLALLVQSARDPVANAQERYVFADNLRVSQGALTDDQHVYELLSGVSVPEPAMLMVAPLALLCLRRRAA